LSRSQSQEDRVTTGRHHPDGASGNLGADDHNRAAATRPAELDTATIHNQRMAGLGALTAGIAHELNNPIGYIGSNLNTLRRYVDAVTELMAQADQLIDPAKRAVWVDALAKARWSTIRSDLAAVVDETRQGAEHVKSVVSDLKLLARTTATPEHVLIDHCITAALSVLTHQLKHRCQVERQLSCKNLLLVVRSQIIQLIINVVHNAAQAVPAGGLIRITSHSDEGWATVVVEDNGPGIPEHLRHEVFTPFFTNKPGGTGLGLPIVARIAQSHGGQVSIDQSPTLGGARFTMVLRHWQES
jgi:two-component system, NtrC family, sensor kinase